jgi:hypothetical protein
MIETLPAALRKIAQRKQVWEKAQPIAVLIKGE